ncbi:hypothetical protein T05_218 [Trichinella murrelli]|uniref:Uncharacterized protein n=1 Tax=Trichinella murrelli TaxID=144512 RepID=A0A0V0U5M1_9BILA|nr:hypothetical protein T05_218 [Trichinella murrelli]
MNVITVAHAVQLITIQTTGPKSTPDTGDKHEMSYHPTIVEHRSHIQQSFLEEIATSGTPQLS